MTLDKLPLGQDAVITSVGGEALCAAGYWIWA